jgi:hypothetical protein
MKKEYNFLKRERGKFYRSVIQLEDQEDLAAFNERMDESTISYEQLLKNLRAHGKI